MAVYHFGCAYAFDKLIGNLKLNPTLETRVHPVHCFLTNEETSQIPQFVSSSWSIKESLNSSQRNQLDMGIEKSLGGAKAFTLDQWVKDNNLQKLDYIKVQIIVKHLIGFMIKD